MVNSKMFSTTQLKWVLLDDRTGFCISFRDDLNLQLSLNFCTVLFLVLINRYIVVDVSFYSFLFILLQNRINVLSDYSSSVLLKQRRRKCLHSVMTSTISDV